MNFISDDTEILYCGKDMEEAYQMGRADRSKELADMISSVNLDSNYIYLCINRDKIKLPHFRYVSELLSWVKEQINEKKNDSSTVD